MKHNLNTDKFPLGVNVSGLIQSEKVLGSAVRSDIEALKTTRILICLEIIEYFFDNRKMFKID